ncbi:hypothetical protein Pcinc_013119 [Petrolisthes cinctipes]|uniref:Regulatory protein zeste n=1 Tax=Petrolisthes cinctipes TaxID=88211 RepID=A0AAE1KSK9_PETCI|nr:hypothetical protein Pcinc_013119 [Petrolisthes cinctipes]
MTSEYQPPTKMPCLTQKAQPLTEQQRECLLTLIKEREAILNSTATDSTTLPEKKARCWDDITRLFNASHPHLNYRTTKQLKRSWHYIKHKQQLK